ncbi:MAG: hypothetical protein WDN02_14865 [Methylovirgula sp.]|uniref:hypothetical protein n=1 Tax=Methylovirgula sp. TaxID=1978224 RepID=UPI003076817B
MLVESGCDQLAGASVCPTVIGANKAASVSRIAAAELRAAMPTAIQKRVNLPVFIARDNDLRAAKRADNKITRIWDLGFVTEKYPGSVENSIHLKTEDVVRNKNLATYGTGVFVNPRYL